jgi:hypothetical protein
MRRPELPPGLAISSPAFIHLIERRSELTLILARLLSQEPRDDASTDAYLPIQKRKWRKRDRVLVFPPKPDIAPRQPKDPLQIVFQTDGWDFVD